MSNSGAASRARAASKKGWAVGLACCLGLQSCAGPDFQAPAPPAAVAFTPERLPSKNTADGKTQRLQAGNELPAEWWKLFHSSELNALIERALRDNPNADAAQAAMRVAQANVYAEAGQLFPSATGEYSVNGGKVSNDVSSPLASGNPYYILHTAQFTVSYVPDVWGGTRRQIENLEAVKENQRFMNEATFLTLTSNIALGAIQEASLREQIKVTERLIKIAKEVLGKVRIKKEFGQVSGLDVAAQETFLAQTEAALPPLRKALAAQRDALTVLAGHLPGEGLSENFNFTNLRLPRNLPVSLPSELIAQRPDVRAAEANMHAACALIGVSIANRLPQFPLTGNIGRSGIRFQNLFSNNTAFLFYTGLANASQVLFDGFTLQQKQRAAEAGFDQVAAQYRLTVLTAFQNVADALYAIRHDTELLEKTILAEAAAKKALDLTRVQLETGQIDSVMLLLAQTTYLQTSLAVITAQANRYSDSVGLFQALGGGWWNRAAPPHVEQPEAWLTSVTGSGPNPAAVEYPGATHNEARPLGEAACCAAGAN